MKVLALDTSSVVASVAVMDDARLLSEYSVCHGMTHSQKLMPMVDDVLRGLGMKPSDMDIFAVSNGPGSFTGLRIGVTAVKAMAYAVKKPVAGVPTLDALAYNLPASDTLVCPIMDARNNQVFTAVYKWTGGKPRKITGYMGVELQELLQLLSGKNEDVVFNGDAALMHEDRLKSALGKLCTIAPGNLLLQKASSVALAALSAVSDGGMQESFDLVPFYLRKSQAEREMDRQSGQSLS